MRDLHRRPGDLTLRQRWAYLIPVLVCAVDWRAHLPAQIGLVVSFFLGLAAGVLWQCLFRRDLVERFLGFSVLAVIFVLIAMLPGDVVDSRSTEDLDWLGVFVGLVLCEDWLRHRRDPRL
ncbi:MAG: hypothetical protein ACXVD1_05720 [Nocardioides sp.]